MEVWPCPVPLYLKQLESTWLLSPLFHSPDLCRQPNSSEVPHEQVMVTGTTSLCFEVAAAALPIFAWTSGFSSADEYCASCWHIPSGCTGRFSGQLVYSRQLLTALQDCVFLCPVGNSRSQAWMSPKLSPFWQFFSFNIIIFCLMLIPLPIQMAVHCPCAHGNGCWVSSALCAPADLGDTSLELIPFSQITQLGPFCKCWFCTRRDDELELD